MLPKVVKESEAKQYIEQMRKPNLVFLTEDNHEKVKAFQESLIKS